MWDRHNLQLLLQEVACGERSPADALRDLSAMPYEHLGCAKVDHHRALRQGFPEVIFCQSKTPEQVALIISAVAAAHDCVLGTRASPAQFELSRSHVPELRYDALARIIWLDRRPQRSQRGGVLLITAGTADLATAEEAAVSLELMGHRPERLHDVGVAGLHRLLSHLSLLQAARVIVVVAGMDGALPAVVAGLVRAPVIAVPTSVGYGANFGGVAPLLTMLNSCAAGVAVVNIDNGYGAAHLAAAINATGDPVTEDVSSVNERVAEV